MDTKSKNNSNSSERHSVLPDTFEELAKSFHKRPKGSLVVFILVFLFLAMTLQSGLALMRSSQFAASSTVSFSDKVARNMHTRDAVERLAKNLHRYFVYYGGPYFLSLSDADKVTQEDISQKRDELFTQYSQASDELWNNYRDKINQSTYYVIEENFNGMSPSEETTDYISARFVEERDESLKKLLDSYDFSSDNISEIVIKEKEDNFKDISHFLQSSELKYHVTYKGEIYTNSDDLTSYDPASWNQAYLGYIHITDPMLSLSFNDVIISDSFVRNNISGYILFPADITNYSNLWYAIEQIMTETPDYTINLIAWFAISILLFLSFVGFVYQGKSQGVNKFLYKIYNYQPLTVKITGAVMSVAISFLVLEHIDSWLYSLYVSQYFSGFETTLLTLMLAGGLIYLFFTLEYIIVTLRNIKGLKDEWEVKTCKKLFGSWKYLFKFKDILLIFIYFLVPVLGGLTYILFIAMDASFIILAPIIVSLIYIAHKFIINHAKLGYYINEISNGTMTAIPEEKGLFKQSINQLNSLNSGVKKSMYEMVKSERLKAELITNVSHDLKTPLTAIINYIELLKSTPSQNLQALEYIDVLDKKSARLKALIDDLFEAAKLGSGSVELEREKVDIVNLLNQTMGELDEKIVSSGVLFKVSCVPEHIYLYLDGKKIWRAFENLLNNIIKYSPSGSRAYISMRETSSGAEIIFKNTSAYELNIDADELFERFKRGDISRATEGSGLGLSIARNIINLHGGEMTLHIDGDLFKVIIQIG